MAQYFLLIKRKGSKNWIGAYKTKPGSSKEKIQQTARKQFKSGITWRIITLSDLQKLTKNMTAKKLQSMKIKRKPRKRRVRKKKRK